MTDKTNRYLSTSLYAVAALLAISLLVAIAYVLIRTNENYAEAAETYEEQYMPGQSLDAVKVNAPTFSTGKYAYKVADRTSGATGWLVLMDGEWVYIPVTFGTRVVGEVTE